MNPSSTRRNLLGRAAIAGGAAAAGSVVAGRLTSSARAATSPAQDVKILNLALLLEYVESAFYADALAKGKLRGELREFAEVVGGHEVAHREFLLKALGSKARKKPAMQFGDATSSPRAFVKGALALEDTGVAAYNGQATNLTPAALAAAARIVSVEARHAAWIRSIAGKTPAAEATDPSITAAQALAALRKTGFLRS